MPFDNPLKERFESDFFRQLPRAPGVYFFLDGRRVPLYIGRADNLKKRLLSYRAAKPGQVADHTLEMLGRATSIRWEIHPSGRRALQREAELLAALRPPYNIVGTDPRAYLTVAVKDLGPRRGSKEQSALTRLELRLTHDPFDPSEGFALYGAYQHKPKVKAGYSALLRLFFAVSCRRENFYFPARLVDSAPSSREKFELPRSWDAPLRSFLEGKSPRLLEHIALHLLAKPNVPKLLNARLQADLKAAKEFFRVGARATRRITLAEKEPEAWVSPERLRRLVALRTLKGL